MEAEAGDRIEPDRFNAIPNGWFNLRTHGTVLKPISLKCQAATLGATGLCCMITAHFVGTEAIPDAWRECAR
jgi:hypothetical protein